jgi:HEPN domain-containing protein
MSRNGLRRHYDRLTPEERFRLDVLAMARGDAAESERLVGSCPKLSYRMNDRAFVGRWTGAMDLTLRTYIPLEKLLCNLQMIDAFRQLVPYAQALSRSVATESYFVGHQQGSLQAWAEAGEVGRPLAWPELDAEKPEAADEDPAVGRDMEDLDWKLNKYGELLPEIMDRMERKLAQDALDLWSGFAALCAESMGVAAENILAVTLQGDPGAEAVARVEGLKDLARRLGLEPDPEAVEEVRGYLAAAWHMVEERGA